MKLRTILLVALGIAAIGVPQASAATAPVTKAAVFACKAERAQLGRATFRATYPGATPFRNCVRQNLAEATQAVRNAAQECRQERAADPDAFKETYGDNETGANAFGRCVSQKAKAKMRPEVAATVAAAQSCKAERRADPAAFHTKYANENGRRAFARCVAQTKST